MASVNETITFLRALADFYEAHPELPLPFELTYYGYLSIYCRDASIIARLGSFEKRFDGDRFIAVKRVAGQELRFSFAREEVCTARVVGKRVIEAHVVPAKPEEVIPEHEEDIIEWECEPVLAAGSVSDDEEVA